MGNSKRKRKERSGFHPFLFLLGSKTLSCSREYAEALLNICSNEDISYLNPVISEDKFTLCCMFFQCNKLKRKSSEYGIELSEISARGIPQLIINCKKRPGIPIGILLSVLLIFMSGRVIWDVRIDGADRMDDGEVIEILGQCGLSVGSKKKSLDIDVIENRVLILSDDISWISVNIRGTVANVEIRELELPPDDGDDFNAANLVSSHSGLVTGFEDVRGNILVNIGDAISRGQLLVGGIYGDEEYGFRLVPAKGKVFAETSDSLSEEIQRSYKKKIRSGKQKCEKSLIFFKKEIKFFKNSGNLYPTYDKIDVVEFLSAPNGSVLPFGVHTVRYFEYTEEEAEHSDEELFNMAKLRLDNRLSAMLSQGELLRKNIYTDITDNGIFMEYRIRCIINVARREEIATGP